ncbi:MAG: SMEK domain-containing protein [Bacteroidetes bacterium]|nr:SMEK domain-containing protein [Bacteroidota bacterium]
MQKAVIEINEIRDYFVSWITKIKIDNALSFFDINKISEGTVQRLLQLIYGYDLLDLNDEKKNFPGIDLGNRTLGLAFQVTSRTDAKKITDTLETFIAQGYTKDFPKGIRFFIISDNKMPRINVKALNKYKPIFNIKKDLYYPAQLIQDIENLYYSDTERFTAIRNFLAAEFGQHRSPLSITKLTSSTEKLKFYKRLFSANYQPDTNRFVDFACKMGEEEILTKNLPERLLASKGIIITGPSGCGKSILARLMAVTFLSSGLPVLVEAKYYDGDFNMLFDKEAKAFGFDDGNDLLISCNRNELKILLIVDGFNECKATMKAKLLLELEYVFKTHRLLLLITSQILEDSVQALNLTAVSISHPDLAIKKAIATKYSNKKNSEKLDTILAVVSSGLEAKMIGEIGSSSIEKISKFTIFETFIKKKLNDWHADGITLLSHIARFLSNKVAFSLSERQIENLLQSIDMPDGIYRKCISAGLIENKGYKVSFVHEMFFNFFVADSVVRFAITVDDIINGVNAPKNHDKKLLIIGSIADIDLLNKVLQSLADVDLLVTLYAGEGGHYGKLWMERQLKMVLVKICDEIGTLDFEFGENALNGIQFTEESYNRWTDQELALISTIPYILVKNNLIPEVFDLVGLMDDRCEQAIRKLWKAAKQKNISVRSAIFATTYIGLNGRDAAITKIFSSLQSGFVTFRAKSTITELSIQEVIKNRILKPGQFYLLLLLLRYEGKLRLCYPYVITLLKNWRSAPYYLLNEVLHQIGYCYNTDEQRNDLIQALNTIHSETQNVWLSTSIFDALGQLGALNEAATDYEPTVQAEIMQVLNRPPDDKEAWDSAAGIYYAQFDHPYDTAYQNAIQQLAIHEKTTFYKMALQGYNSSLFTTALMIDAWKQLSADIAPYLVRWVEHPILEPSSPQDSLKTFLIAHLFLAKANYPIISRYASEADPKNRSLFSAAEVYYWLNRSDFSVENKEKAVAASKVLFDRNNRYCIESIWQFCHALHQSSLQYVLDLKNITTIESAFPDHVTAFCRKVLENLEWQLSIFGFPKDHEEINTHAIWLLENNGSIIDVDLLKPLSNHSRYGRHAVEAIKKLSYEN